MPLVAHNDLPAYTRLQLDHHYVMSKERALQQDIRPMHIGVLNMMPDAALEATERQFLSLIGESNKMAQIYVHLFTLPELERGENARKHIAQHYSTFEQIKEHGLDGLIITGANAKDPDLTKAPFYAPLEEVIDWAQDNVTSTLFSCLATHAVMSLKADEERVRLMKKRWGVYKHHVVDAKHPLVQGLNSDFVVPHSRNNEIMRHQFENAGLRILIESEKAGVHLACSQDGFRWILLQGHQEYDARSLFKEYQREVKSYTSGERDNYPPFPENYFSREARLHLNKFKYNTLWQGSLLGKATKRLGAVFNIAALKDDLVFPEKKVLPLLKNQWHDTGRSLMGNWLGYVYQTTNMDLKKQYMDGVDPHNPLGPSLPVQTPAAPGAE